MSKRTFRTGIIGCGGISQVHMNALMGMDGVEIVAVCDIREERAQAAAQKTGARRVYTDWHELLRDPEVEVVHLCTPHYLHAPMTVEALSLGKHVLTEKPMATTLEDARAMIAAAERPGAPTLGVIFQNRYNDAVQRARSILASGDAGAFLGARADVSWRREVPYYHDSGWRGTRQMEGAGSLINQSIHTLDLMSYLGGPIARVRGSVFTGLLEGQIEVEDNCAAVALFEGGQRAVIHTTNNNVCDAPVELELYCEKYSLRLVGLKLYRVEKGLFTLLEDGAAPSLDAKAYWGSGHGVQIADYYRALDAGEHYWLDGRQAFPALSLVRSIIESSEKGAWIELPRA